MARKNTHSYRYSLSAHHVDEVFERMERAGQQPTGERVLYCDTDGACVFDKQDASYLGALADILNTEAAGEKRLKQLIFREQQMIAIWEERQKEVEG